MAITCWHFHWTQLRHILSNTSQVKDVFNSLKRCRRLASTLTNDTEFCRSMGQPTPFTHPYLMKEGEVTPGLGKQDYAARREALMNLLTDNIRKSDKSATADRENVVILFGEPVTYMAEDVPYPFHQNANFRYLTGFLEPGSCLIMESVDQGSSPSKQTLLVPERDAIGEMWHGPRAGTDGARHLTGIERTDAMENFPKLISRCASEDYNIWYDFQKPANLHLHMQYMRSFLTDAYNKKMKISSVTESVHRLRVRKSQKEISLLLEAASITSESFARAMPACFPGMNEGALHAMLECECRFKGAQKLAYPPVVAGGVRANTLHYIANNQRIRDSEMVLVDAGADYHGYAADVTRTWPINGRFSRAQRTLYDVVLRVQLACIEMCRPGVTLDHVYGVMATLLGQELVRSGIIAEKVDDKDLHQLGRRYCPHHVGHWLGMDVHDTSSVPRSTSLQPGMVVTVEPGLYIHLDDVRVPEEFRGIGIRIEDDVVVTSDQPIVLSADCPKDPDHIEKIMS